METEDVGIVNRDDDIGLGQSDDIGIVAETEDVGIVDRDDIGVQRSDDIEMRSAPYFTSHCSFLISPLSIIRELLPHLIPFSPSYFPTAYVMALTFSSSNTHCIFHAFYSSYNLPSLQRPSNDVRELPKIKATIDNNLTS
ncbi:hypothetical protein BYT27DRAFT_7203942, partial [Phlegmacium glaucopus]